MIDPDPLFTEPTPDRFHVADPWTAKAAGRRIAFRVGSIAYEMLRALADEAIAADALGVPRRGFTAFELAGGEYATTAGSRLGEMVAIGVAVELEGVSRSTDTGTAARAHTVTAAGLEQWRQLAELPAYRDAPRRPTTGPKGRKPGPPRPSPRGFTASGDKVLDWLSLAQSTDYELSLRLPTFRHAVAGLRLPLVSAGYVEASGKTRPTDSGSPATVWRITEAGVAELRRRASRSHRMTAHRKGDTVLLWDSPLCVPRDPVVVVAVYKQSRRYLVRFPSGAELIVPDHLVQKAST